MNVRKSAKALIKAQGVIFIIMSVAYVVNVIKFIQQDFEAPYKSEVIHGIGVVVPPAASVTVWF